MNNTLTIKSMTFVMHHFNRRSNIFLWNLMVKVMVLGLIKFHSRVLP